MMSVNSGIGARCEYLVWCPQLAWCVVSGRVRVLVVSQNEWSREWMTVLHCSMLMISMVIEHDHLWQCDAAIYTSISGLYMAHTFPNLTSTWNFYIY
jgi:hypothetical protein